MSFKKILTQLLVDQTLLKVFPPINNIEFVMESTVYFSVSGISSIYCGMPESIVEKNTNACRMFSYFFSVHKCCFSSLCIVLHAELVCFK